MTEAVSETHLETDDRPEQFKMMQASLHAERERVKGLAQDWVPSLVRDVRDIRDAQLLGETLLRMRTSLGLSCSETHDVIEGLT